MNTIYKVSFLLGNGSRPSLEDVVKTIKEWALRKLKLDDLQNFENNVTFGQAGATLETITADDSSTRYFGLRLEHPDYQHPALKWGVTACIKESKGSVRLAVSLSNALEDGIMRPIECESSRPGIVPTLIDRFGACEDYEIKTTPMEVFSPDAKKIAARIFDTGRKLPIVYISTSNKSDQPLIDPRKTAYEMAGLAHVCVLGNKHVSFTMLNLMGKSMNCYNGAVRVYMPSGQNVNATHPIWMPSEVSETQNFVKMLLKMLSQYSTSVKSPLTFEDILRINKDQQLESFKQMAQTNREKQDEYIQFLFETNERLQSEITAQSEKFDQEKRTLQFRLTEMEQAIRTLRKGKSADEQESLISQIASIGSVKGALEVFKKIYTTATVQFNTKAEKGANDSVYENPVLVYKALEWLASVYLNAKTGKINVDLQKSAKEQLGMDYKPMQSDKTLGQFSREYETLIDGEKITLEEHLAKGSSRRPTETIRIAFAYRPKDRVVIVGYIGQHQRNTHS